MIADKVSSSVSIFAQLLESHLARTDFLSPFFNLKSVSVRYSMEIIAQTTVFVNAFFYSVYT